MSKTQIGFGTAMLITLATALWWQRDDITAEAAYETTRVDRGTLDRTVTATGVIRPVVGAEIVVGSRVSGRVERLPVQVGDAVEAGDLLAQLDASVLDAEIDQATAELAVAQAERDEARGDFQRAQQLADEGIVPKRELEQAQRALTVAEARVKKRQAQLASAEIQRGYTRIVAPIRGVIAEVTTREGETVAASFASPEFVTIIDLDQLEVRAFVDETDIGRVRVGQVAAFTVDTYPQRNFAATVTAIEPKAELQNSVVNYVIVLTFETDSDVVLRPEMTARLRIELERRDDVLTVPRKALHRRDGRQFVTVQRAGEWIEQEVTSGWRTDQAVEIVTGLDEGDLLRLHPS